jgi:hypothetical protein
MLSLAFNPLVSGQVGALHANMGCPRRLAFDLSSATNEAIGSKIEWTAATAPTGTVYSPATATACPSGINSGGITSNLAARNQNCPTNGVPFGMNSATQYDQAGGTNAGFGPFSQTASGKVRIKNVATDSASTPPNRVVDILISIIPDASMFIYTPALKMEYNSPVMPWNNDVPATQFSLSKGGLIGLGFGIKTATCVDLTQPPTYPLQTPSLSAVNFPYCGPTQPNNGQALFNNFPRGYAAEYLVEFVYGDSTFSFGSYQAVSPPLTNFYVVFWDVDGDHVDNSLEGSTLTDVAGVPPVAQTGTGTFPPSEIYEDLQEVNAVRDAMFLIEHGDATINASFGISSSDKYIYGKGPPFAGRASDTPTPFTGGNVATDFSVNPYQDAYELAYENALSKPAIGKYLVPDGQTQFKIMIGGITGVGRQYRHSNSASRPYGIRATSTSTTNYAGQYGNPNMPLGPTLVDNANGPLPKLQNDRGYLMSILYPEPRCTCETPCPAECAPTAQNPPTWCARLPQCTCPSTCQVTNPAPECSIHCGCPTQACPAVCTQAQTASSKFYYTFCKANPQCACPAECSACTGANGGTAVCPSVCMEFASCPGGKGCESCAGPLPPPFPPPFPPLPCHGWCNANTCDKAECKGCSTCDHVATGSYCASWCNTYTCSDSLCHGCGVCSAPASSSTCHSWCSAYTCFGSCTSCAVCGQVATSSYCAKWCNAYTCGGLFSGLCGGCSECAEVNSNSYCASWCNSYTCGGVFTGLCGGCSECA